jgi:hypothetical protein
MKFRRLRVCLPSLIHLRPSAHLIPVMKTFHPVTVTNSRWLCCCGVEIFQEIPPSTCHRVSADMNVWQHRRVNFPINTLRGASGNLWRVVVPRGAVPPDSVVDPQPPLHWGYSGGSNNWPTPTSTPSRTPMKRHHSESDECDDVFSEESSKEQ